MDTEGRNFQSNLTKNWEVTKNTLVSLEITIAQKSSSRNGPKEKGEIETHF